ncbi:hypothetical protein ACW23B_16860 [Streptomyces albidoflavus]
MVVGSQASRDWAASFASFARAAWRSSSCRAAGTTTTSSSLATTRSPVRTVTPRQRTSSFRRRTGR